LRDCEFSVLGGFWGQIRHQLEVTLQLPTLPAILGRDFKYYPALPRIMLDLWLISLGVTITMCNNNSSKSRRLMVTRITD